MDGAGRADLTDAVDGFCLEVTHLILDRDSLYTQEFRKLLSDAGVNIVRLPRESPNLSAFAERFVLSIRSECLHRVIPVGEAHLRRLVHQFAEHHHRERPHQGLDGELLAAEPRSEPANDPNRCHSKLGGPLNYYYREAA